MQSRESAEWLPWQLARLGDFVQYHRKFYRWLLLHSFVRGGQTFGNCSIEEDLGCSDPLI